MPYKPRNWIINYLVPQLKLSFKPTDDRYFANKEIRDHLLDGPAIKFLLIGAVI